MNNKDFSKELLELFESEDAVLFVAKDKPKAPTADDRLAHSFLEIVEFVSKNDREPRINAEDFGEQLLAKRLESIKCNHEKVIALEKYDSLGLLEQPDAPKTIEELLENDAFGIFNGDENKIFELKNVKPRRVENFNDERSVRMPAKDFSVYRPLFEEMQKNLKAGESKLIQFTSIEQLHVGRFYINSGQMVYVVGEGEIDQKVGYKQQRLQVIIENGTESNMYKRSLAQRLYEGGYCVVSVDETIEFAFDDNEHIAGYLYVVRSLSSDLKITTIANLHKIGFSTTPVQQRIASAKVDPTYLMSEVELVEIYKLTGDYNPQKVEHMIHRVFADVALDLTIIDKEGREYKPMEWYSVPIHIIREVVDLIHSGEIVQYVYNSNTQRITKLKN